MKKTIFTLVIFNLIIFDLQPGYSQMFWNRAASFAGNNTSYISVPNSASINFTGSFTIEAWINPSSLSGLSKGIFAKGSTLGSSMEYGVRLNSAGRIMIITNGTVRLISRLSSAITINRWTHFTATYNSSTSEYKIFLNDNQDTSATVAGSSPTSNIDSLYIGISGSTTPFNGKIDEVRIWNRGLSAAEALLYYRTSLSTSSGVYSGLVLSIPFQKESSSGAVFNAKDYSGNNNNGTLRNVTQVDLSNRPSDIISFNESIVLDGFDDYLAAKDTSTIDPTTGITLECWIFPRTSHEANLITKGPPSDPDYALIYENNTINAKLNGTLLYSGKTIQTNCWNFVSFTYNSNSQTSFFINNTKTNQTNILGNIATSTDSLYIGGGPGIIPDFNGYIDEVRIANYSKSFNDIHRFFHRSIDAQNDPLISGIDISYNLDGSTLDNSQDGGPKLILRNNAKFSHPCTNLHRPVSPLNRYSGNIFSNGFYIADASVRLPLTGTAGTDSLSNTVNLNSTITDLNLFVALNHSNSSNLDIVLIGPGGDSVKVFNNNFTASNDNSIIAVFDDQADSALVSDRYISFSTKLRPANSLNSVFGGRNTQGKWTLRVRDESTNDTGFINGWGLQFNNDALRRKDLTLNILMQGLYDSLLNTMVEDTVKVYLRKQFSPFNIVDSSVSVVNFIGTGLFSFTAPSDSTYSIEIRHRNSIETWNSSIISVFFFDSEILLAFKSFQTFALGNNLIRVDNSPPFFAIYSGDVDQDGFVDLDDVISISNNASVFTSGYVVQDLTGDNLVDLNDLLIAYNNSNNFVSVIRP